MEAFRAARAIDCDIVEFDLHMTRDGQIVVMHDHTVRRTTDGIGRVDDLTLGELKRFHEKNGESIPTLQHVIDVLKNHRKMMLDIKDHAAESKILEIITVNDILEDVIIDSDDPEIVVRIKQLDPRVCVFLGGVTGDNFRDVAQHAKQIGAKMIKTHRPLVTKAFVQTVHEHGIGVYVWGAEKDPDILEMLRLGVDAIVCKFPDRISPLQARLAHTSS